MMTAQEGKSKVNNMNDKEQTEAFANDLDKLVERYRQEFEMSYAATVGTLQMKIHLLCNEAQDRKDELD